MNIDGVDVCLREELNNLLLVIFPFSNIENVRRANNFVGQLAHYCFHSPQFLQRNRLSIDPQGGLEQNSSLILLDEAFGIVDGANTNFIALGCVFIELLSEATDASDYLCFFALSIGFDLFRGENVS